MTAPHCSRSVSSSASGAFTQNHSSCPFSISQADKKHQQLTDSSPHHHRIPITLQREKMCKKATCGTCRTSPTPPPRSLSPSQANGSRKNHLVGLRQPCPHGPRLGAGKRALHLRAQGREGGKEISSVRLLLRSNATRAMADLCTRQARSEARDVESCPRGRADFCVLKDLRLGWSRRLLGLEGRRLVGSRMGRGSCS